MVLAMNPRQGLESEEQSMKEAIRGLVFVVVWFLVFLLVIPWLFYLAEQSSQIQQFEQQIKAVEEQIRHAIGGVMSTIGIVVALGGALMLAVRGRGTPAPFNPPQRFVAVGLYKWCRNPVMLANVIALFGYSIYFRSWTLLVYALLFWLVSHLFILFYEEPNLLDRFGDDYRRYMDTTPRWWPRFRRPDSDET